MIIFYRKSDNFVVGTIGGRLHQLPQLNMWLGKKEDNDRLVINWKKDQDGSYSPDVESAEFKTLLKEFEAKPSLIYDYKVDPEKKILIKK